MRIAGLEIFVAVNDLAGRVWNPKIRWTKKYSLLVEVTSDSGQSGLGECWCFDRSPEPLAVFLEEEVAPRILGCDALDRVEVARRLNDTTTLSARHGIMASALSGIDIALWDMAAKAERRPLYRLLGSAGRPVPVYASGGLYGEGKTPQDLAEELAGFLAAGFTTVKMKVGGLAPEEDALRVRTARSRLGPEAGLILDGVYSYSEEGALAFFEQVAEERILAFQSPLPAEELEAMARLVARGVPVMALEAEYRPLVLRRLLEERAVAALQISPIACGGLTAALALADLAGQARLPLSLEVSSTAVAQMAAFHLAAAASEVREVEVHGLHRVLFDRFPFASSAIQGGLLALPEAPGLGISLPQERADLRRYRRG